LEQFLHAQRLMVLAFRRLSEELKNKNLSLLGAFAVE
jgi:hypothetical protein